MLPEIQDQGQVDKLQVPKRGSILFLIQRCPERSIYECILRSGSLALFYIIFFLPKKPAENQNLLPLFPISTPERGTLEHVQ